MNTDIKNIVLSSLSNRELAKFLEYFSAKLERYALLFNIADEELEDVQHDMAYWQWLNKTEQQSKETCEQIKVHVKSMRITTYFEQTKPLLLEKINLIPPVQVKPELHRRYGQLFNKIRNSPAFTMEIGTDLGLMDNKWRYENAE